MSWKPASQGNSNLVTRDTRWNHRRCFLRVPYAQLHPQRSWVSDWVPSVCLIKNHWLHQALLSRIKEAGTIWKTLFYHSYGENILRSLIFSPSIRTLWSLARLIRGDTFQPCLARLSPFSWAQIQIPNTEAGGKPTSFKVPFSNSNRPLILLGCSIIFM